MSTTHDTAEVEILHIDGNGVALYQQYKGQSSPQPCYIELHCESRTLTADSNPEIGNGVPVYVWHHRILRWNIPALTDDACNSLLDELAEDAKIVCDGYTCEWDGHNHIGVYTQAAEEAQERIGAYIDAQHWTAHDTVEIWDAADWYVDSSTTDDLGITATTTDEQLAEIATREDQAASADGYTVEGILEHLTAIRDRLVTDAEEIEEEEPMRMVNEVLQRLS
jgi:hypothetical protein